MNFTSSDLNDLVIGSSLERSADREGRVKASNTTVLQVRCLRIGVHSLLDTIYSPIILSEVMDTLVVSSTPGPLIPLGLVESEHVIEPCQLGTWRVHKPLCV